MPRTVLVTGASSGIGRATCEAFAAAGWRVLATARKETDLRDLEAAGCTAIPMEATSDESVAHAAEAALAAGPPDVVVLNAGYGALGPVATFDRDAWRQQFEVNVFHHFDLVRRLLPTMKARGGGRLIFMSSVAGRVGVVFAGVYTASKHAVEAAVDALRVEVARDGVHVTLVEPGYVRTRFSSTATGVMDAQLTPEYLVARESAAPLITGILPPVTAERVARVVVREATRRWPRRRRIVGWQGRWGLWLWALTPRWLTDRVQRLVLRL